MTTRRNVSATRLVVLASAFLAAAAVVRSSRVEAVVPPRQPLRGFPIRIADWTGRALPDFDGRVVRVLGADDYLTRVYRHGTAPPVDLFVGYYGSQRTGAVIHSPLNCLPGAGWQPVDRRHVQVELSTPDAGAARRIEVNRVVVQKGEERQVAFYWYHERGRVIASEYASRVFMVMDGARYGRTDGALVRVMTPISSNRDDVDAATLRLVGFVRAIFPLLSGYLPA